MALVENFPFMSFSSNLVQQSSICQPVTKVSVPARTSAAHSRWTYSSYPSGCGPTHIVWNSNWKSSNQISLPRVGDSRRFCVRCMWAWAVMLRWTESPSGIKHKACFKKAAAASFGSLAKNKRKSAPAAASAQRHPHLLLRQRSHSPGRRQLISTQLIKLQSEVQSPLLPEKSSLFLTSSAGIPELLEFYRAPASLLSQINTWQRHKK